MTPKKVDNIRIITVSGRIASGATTLAKQLAEFLDWRHIEGGEIFWEAIRKRLKLANKDTGLRPDEEDILFDKKLREILRTEEDVVLETKLASYNAQGVDGIYKILVICEDKYGADQTQIRIDRLVNREGISVEKAKEEVIEREENDISKWRKLYGNGDLNWTYLNKNYYDLVINTYESDKEKALNQTLKAMNLA